MKLEEAKNLLLEMRDNCLKDGKYNDPKRKDKAEAIETVLQEIEHLQKENEELKEDTRSRVVGCRDLAKKCEECTLKECIGCEYSISDLSTTLKNFVSKDKIRDLISKLDIDIERNKKREIMYKEEKGTSGYVCKLIAYMPETVKGVLIDLLKEE